jgi:excisionase family DNA binding protein
MAGARPSPRILMREQVADLKDLGLSYSEIGRWFGITKQRVAQLLGTSPKEHFKPVPKLPESKKMLTTVNVASLLGIHPNTVRRWSDRGILKSYRICDRGDRRFVQEDIKLLVKHIAKLKRNRTDKTTFNNIDDVSS